MKNKTRHFKSFTLIEILIVISIISVLATIVLVSVSQSRKNARINAAKTSLKTVLTAIVACTDAGGAITTTRTPGNPICNPATRFSSASWPVLPSGYSYGSGTYNSNACSFIVDTNDDLPSDLTCSCISQICN